MLSLLLILVFYKVGHIMKKVTLVDKGLSFYEDKEWIKAEANLQQANTYNWFEYKKEITNNYLQSLDWITQFNPLMSRLSTALEESETSKDYGTFTQLWEEYEASRFSELSESQKEYLLSYYPVDTQIDEGWKSYKALMEDLLSKPTPRVNYNWAKKAIFEVPDKYFKEDKESTIKALFITCDSQLIDESISKLAKEEGYLTFKALLESLNAIYEINAQVGYESKWLTDRIKPYIKTTLETKSKHEDITVFARYIEVYRQSANGYYKDEEIETVVESFINEQEVKAATLIGNQSYDEAISLYEAMKYFKDYKEEIKEIHMMKEYDNEELLLSSKEEEYSFIKKGTNALGATKYIMGIHTVKGSLEVVTIDGVPKDYVTNTYEIPLSSKTPQDIQVIDHLMLLTSEGTSRNNHFELLMLQSSTLNKLLEIEANSLEVLEGGNKLKINSPESGYEGYDYEYIYTETGYIESEMISTPISLDDDQVTSYVGNIVRFSCYVPEEMPGDTTLGMFIKDNVYYPNLAAELYLEEGQMITTGTYTVVGEYIENVLHTDSETGETTIRPRIKVLKLN